MTPHAHLIATLLVETTDQRCLTAASRPPGLRDGADALSELAMLAAALDWRTGALAIPVRLRDLRHDEIEDSRTLITTLERQLDGAVRMTAQLVATGDAAAAAPHEIPMQAVDPAASPVAALLFDAVVRVEQAPPPHQVIAVLRSWGHLIAGDDDLPDVDRRTLGRDRHRVHRLARELGRRNRPVARIETANRPGVPANLPPDFVPACPL